MQSLTMSLAEAPVHLLADIIIKHDKTQCLRVRSSEPRWGTLARAVLRRMRDWKIAFTRQATQGRGGFNRYRAFRQARDMRCMLYVICYWLCILGQVDAILGVHFEHFGVSWVYLGAILGNVGAILRQLWEVLGVLGSTRSSGSRV